MYYFVKMGKTWYCTEYITLDGETSNNIQVHVNHGELVVLADDVEWFCSEMDLCTADITFV